jgi:hypothetical protein
MTAIGRKIPGKTWNCDNKGFYKRFVEGYGIFIARWRSSNSDPDSEGYRANLIGC